MDKDGNVMQQSDLNLALSNLMTIPADLQAQYIEPMGNIQGKEIGTINEYNIIDITITSSIPLELDCIVELTFPSELKLDSSLNQVTGYGMFQPVEQSFAIPSSMYTIDYKKNSISIEACQLSKDLTKNPTGQISFSMIRLPFMVKTTEPFIIKIFSDAHKGVQVVEQTQGMEITNEQLKPGTLDLISFDPELYYALATNVMYTITFAPKHDLFENSRIIIQFPEYVNLHEISECMVLGVPGVNCTIEDDAKNILVVRNYFKNFNQGGKQLQLLIGPANNPTGAREAGPWSVRTETEVDGEYYSVDQQTSPTSFKAIPSFMESFWQSTSLVTFQTEVRYTFSLYPVHGLPPNGYINITFPDDFQITVSRAVESQASNWKAINATQQSFLAQIDENGHDVANNPLDITVRGIRNPRSFRPAGLFNIQTMDEDWYIVCQGGEDLSIAMDQMRLVDNFEVEPANYTNGAITEYQFVFHTAVTIQNGDVFKLTFPDEITIEQSEDDNVKVKCRPGTQIVKISCTAIGQQMNVVLDEISGFRGRYDFVVEKVKNPPSFKPTKSFTGVHIETYDYWDMIEFSDQFSKIVDYSVTTDTIAFIDQFNLDQEVYSYSTPTLWTITFTPMNQISNDGTILIEYPDSIKMSKNSTCVVKTYKSFDQEVCYFNQDSQLLFIHGPFEGLDSYFAQITILIDQVSNPPTNFEIEQQIVNITTFDNELMTYPIDTFSVVPFMECDYPCKFCELDNRQDCNACWDFGLYQYLMEDFDLGTHVCKTQCDSGYSTNGTVTKTCDLCDVSCVTCLDQGHVNDAKRCTQCASQFPYQGESTQMCYRQCPFGMYDKGNLICGDCDSNCGDCNNDSTFCTACDSDSDYPYLYQNKCLAECPGHTISFSGECVPCEYPCQTCINSPSHCTSCQQDSDTPLQFSFQCFEECPKQTSTNYELSICEGCITGCDTCDQFNQTHCYVCTAPFLLVESYCVLECPTDYRPNYYLTQCRHTSDFNLKIIYFPFLICSLILLFVSIISNKRKRKHKVISNFIMMMGPLEHLAIIAQFVLSFLFTSYLYACAIGLVLIIYYIGNALFYCRFIKKIEKGQDLKYEKWRENHPYAKKGIPFLSVLSSWKFYKLLYSHFIGIKIKPCTFDAPWVFISLQKQQMIFTIVFVYFPLFIIDIIGLVSLPWGDQYYITQIETAVISIVITILMIWEQRRIWFYMSQDEFKLVKEEQTLSAIATLADMTSSDLNVEKTKVIAKFRDKLFEQRKVDQILIDFKRKRCMSETGNDSQKDHDGNRRTQSNPVSPRRHQHRQVDHPKPRPLTPVHPTLCFSVARSKHNLKPLPKNAPFKCIQAGEINQECLRQNAQVVQFPEEETGTDIISKIRDEQFSPKKRGRGRRGKYYKQIETEDVLNQMSEDSEDQGFVVRDQEGNKLNIFDPKALAATDHESNQEESAEIKARQQLQKQIQDSRMKQLEEKRKQQEEEDTRQMQELQNAFTKKRLEEQEAIKRKQLAIEQREAERRMHEQKIAMEKQRKIEEAKEQEEELKRQQKREEQRRQEELAQALQKEKQAIIEKKAEEMRRQKEEADREAKRKAEEAMKLMEEQQAKAKALIEDSVDEDEQEAKCLLLGKDVNFDPSEIPTADKRTFNVHDIIAYQSENADNVNQQGYLIDPVTQDILHNKHLTIMFPGNKLTKKGEIPHPFCIEKYNFNPFEMQGSLVIEQEIRHFRKDYDADGQLIDKLERRVNQQGFLIDPVTGALIDEHGNVKFSKGLLNASGSLPYLLNYNGDSFEILDVMGIFDRNKNSDSLQVCRDEKGQAIDKTGHLVNQRGYLINKNGHIISRSNPKLVLFTKDQLKNGEFPKLFQFTQINLKRIKTKHEEYIAAGVDQNSRMINAKGYYTDQTGNILDYKGDLVFDKACLVENGAELPPVFHIKEFVIESDPPSNASDKESSDSTVQSQMDVSPSRNNIINLSKDGALNLVSTYEDQQEDSLQQPIPAKKKKVRGKKNAKSKNRQDAQVHLMSLAILTQQQNVDGAKIMMNTSHSPVQLKKSTTGTRFSNLKKSGGSQRSSRSKSRDRKKNASLSKTDQGFFIQKEETKNSSSIHNQRLTNDTAKQQMLSTLEAGNRSEIAESLVAREYPTQQAMLKMKKQEYESKQQQLLLQQHHMNSTQSQAQIPSKNVRIKQNLKSDQSRKTVDAVGQKRKTFATTDKANFQDEFERMYKKEIEQFLEDSDWDAQSQASYSEISKGTLKQSFNPGKVKELEQVYITNKGGNSSDPQKDQLQLRAQTSNGAQRRTKNIIQ